jgi:D-alanyl-D-alanine carboxypeptidase (penicillin-binding protein 5/6)
MRPALRRGSSLAGAVLLAAAIVVPAMPSYADEPVGGPQLGSTGVVFDHSPGSPPPPAVTAEGWLVADLDSGAVLGTRNPHGKFLPASTLKTLTAISLLPKLSPATIVKPSNAAANIDGTKVGIKPGFPVTVDLLFTGMLIYSGNDTATALAEAAGGEAATVRAMNEQARRLQAMDTLAANPTGLDAAGQVSSPYDLALMGRAALKIPAYARYTKIRKAMVPSPTGSFEIANKNRLLYNYAGAFGGKTGHTQKALDTYIGYAERGPHRLVVTIMKAKTAQWRTEAPKLLDWGFAADGVVAPVGQLVLPVDEIAALPAAAASSGAPSPGASTAATAATPSKAAEPVAGKSAVKAPKKTHESLASRLPTFRLHLQWWYAAVPVGIAALVAVGLAVRRRRRRRRGFYMPQTKLKLPVR